MRIIKPQQPKRQTYTTKTLQRLHELITLLKTYWLVDMNIPITYQAQNSQAHTLRTPLVVLSKPMSSFDSFTMRMRRKLKNVNGFLGIIGVNLSEVIQGLESIYHKISQYEDIQALHSKYLMQSREHSCKISAHSGNYNYNNFNQIQQRFDAQVFQSIFKHIYHAFFDQSLNQLINTPDKKLAIRLLQIQTKLSVIPHLIDSASKFKSDITSCELFSQKFPHAWDSIEMKDMDNIKETVNSQIQYLRRMMKITTSAVVAENSSYNVDLFKKIVFGISYPYFWLADEQSQLRCYQLWRKPKVQNLNKVWDLPQNGAIKQCNKLILPSIRTNFFIYIPFKSNQIMKQQPQLQPQIFKYPSHPQNYVRVLVLYYNKLTFKEEVKKFQPFACWTCWDVQDDIDLDTILIHIHGGGFVSLTSQSSQSYTRVWANKLRIPVFSIDYRKPPDFRFPVPLQDCFTAYQFIIQKIHLYFNIRPKNIIIAGDSAGGNLATALQGMLMLKKYPTLPKGLFLAYPAVDLRMRFSPSRMNSFQDPILPPPLLILCLQQYLGQNSLNQHHPLASPILLSQYFIQTGKQPNPYTSEQLKKWPKNWPPTRIMVGKKDSLYDDSLRLLQRMTYSGVDAKLIIYKQLLHGFLSMDKIITACSQTIQDSVQQIRKLIIK